jgi:hypothetical protein
MLPRWLVTLWGCGGVGATVNGKKLIGVKRCEQNMSTDTSKFTRRSVPADLVEATPGANGLGQWVLASPLLIFLGWFWVDFFHASVGLPVYWLSVLGGAVIYLFCLVLPLGYLTHRLLLLLPRLFQHAGWDLEPLEPVKLQEQYLVRYRYQARRWAANSWQRAWLRAAQGWVFLEIIVILLGAILMIPLYFSAVEFGFGR